MELNDFVNIVGLLAMVITWFIVSPLKSAITTLQELVKELKASIEERRHELSDLGERVAKNEQSLDSTADKIKSTTKRLVELEKEFHAQVGSCHCRKE